MKQNCQLILCLGSSLQILQKYKHLWCEDRVKHLRPKLFIVNLQWTPKDRIAKAKINGEYAWLATLQTKILLETSQSASVVHKVHLQTFGRKIELIFRFAQYYIKNIDLFHFFISPICSCDVAKK